MPTNKHQDSPSPPAPTLHLVKNGHHCASYKAIWDSNVGTHANRENTLPTESSPRFNLWKICVCKKCFSPKPWDHHKNIYKLHIPQKSPNDFKIGLYSGSKHIHSYLESYMWYINNVLMDFFVFYPQFF